MAGGDKDEANLQIEETKAAIRDSVERAHELIVEARFVIRQAEADAAEAADPPGPVPDNPAALPGGD